MPHSEVHLVNMALIRLGQRRITDLTENTSRAILANELYPGVRDEVLTDHPWNSAVKRVSLPKLAAAPEWGFDAAFQLPGDWLALHKLELEDTRWRIERRTILADTDPLNVAYIFRLTDVGAMDELLKQAISSKLALELSLPLTGDVSKQNAMAQLYTEALGRARFKDSQQAPPLDQVASSTWLAGRDVVEPDLRISY